MKYFLIIALVFCGSVSSFEITSPFLINKPKIFMTNHRQDKLLILQVQKNKLLLQKEWHALGAELLSNPHFVGAPQFPFPDRWPLSHETQMPPYSLFRKKFSSREGVCYLLANNAKLYGIDSNGSMQVTIDLLQLLNSSYFDLSQNKTWQRNLLTSMDINVGHWFTLLVGLLPGSTPILFAIDITDPQQIKAPKSPLLWALKLPTGHYQRPVISRFNNGQWGVLLAYEKNGPVGVNILNASNGKKMTDIILSTTTATRKQLSLPVPIDSKGSGYSDYLYLEDNQSQLWKIDLTSKAVDGWRLANHYPIEIQVKTNDFSQQMPGPLIGRHPDGHGVLVYSSRLNSIIALEDDHQHSPTLFFTVECGPQTSITILRSGYLLVNAQQNLKSYDAFTGKFIQNQSLVSLGTILDTAGERYSPVIFLDKPREKRSQMLVRQSQGFALGHIESDYARLGRRTWQEQHGA